MTSCDRGAGGIKCAGCVPGIFLTFVDIIWIRREHPVDIVRQNDVSLAELLCFNIIRAHNCHISVQNDKFLHQLSWRSHTGLDSGKI